MRRDDATFVLSTRPPAQREVTKIVTISAAAGGAIGAFVATVGVVAFFHSREPHEVRMSAPPPRTGTLAIATAPVATVLEGDRAICTATPCANVTLAAGVHDLVVVFAPDKQKRVRVIVEADQKRELRLALKDVAGP